MISIEVRDIFDSAFREVTKKLVGIELKETTGTGQDSEDWLLLRHGYREKIQTNGYMTASIICRFSDSLYQHIVETMSGSNLEQEEYPLYLNEYMNIICGRAVSNVNNLIGVTSRLTVPLYYQSDEPIEGLTQGVGWQKLMYDTSAGTLQVFLEYSFQNE